MTEKKASPKKLSSANTKQELLDAYNLLLEEIRTQKNASMKTEEKREEKTIQAALASVDGISAGAVDQSIAALKGEIGKVLSQISDNLSTEFNRLENLKKAIAFKEKEIQDLYQIDKTAETLAALIEANNRTRDEFEEEMAGKKTLLEQEIETLNRQWAEDKRRRELESKEWSAGEKQRRDREREEFQYDFEREKKLVRNQFEDEKAKLDKEIHLRKEQLEKGFADREKILAERENELAELKKRAAAFPKELENTVSQAVQNTTEKLQSEAKNREDLLKKGFEGEKNVFTTRISSLEKTVKEQAEQLAKLGQQLDKAYQKIEDVAVKTIEGAAQSKAFAGLQQILADQVKKQQDK
ncbi:MAG: hypothetical protein RBT20_12555 [Syntrophales bacterium]|jgi:DNA repair exonuclease SbcCD ATPase subunit|nr:hypothetical protein [Syntrophales bacterium]